MDNRKNVFVIMPFSETETCSESEWTDIYDNVFKPAFEECGCSCERARPGVGSLTRTIIEKLANSVVVLADITDGNPNVFYELGIRHSLAKHTIIAARSTDYIPSDLKGQWSVIYGTKPGEVVKFKGEIRRLISEIGKNPEKSNSPVLDYLERQEFRDYKRVEEMTKKAMDFTAYEIEQTDRQNLDPPSKPIHVYVDPERKIEFGAVFAFALGENPEVLITFEKYPEGISCELVRMGGAEMHVLWKGQEIWKSDHGGEKSPEIPRSYISFWYDDLENGKLYNELDTKDTNALTRDIVKDSSQPLSKEDYAFIDIISALHNWRTVVASDSQDKVDESILLLKEEFAKHEVTVQWNTESHTLSLLKGDRPTHERYIQRLQSAEIAKGPDGSIVRIEIEASITRHDMTYSITKPVSEMLFGR